MSSSWKYRPEEAQRQIRRLAAFGRMWSEMEPEGILELTNTLRDCCDSEPMASLVMDEVLRRDWMPRPRDLMDAAARVAQEAIQADARLSRSRSRGCRACAGTGYSIDWYLVTYRLNDLGQVIGRDARKVADDVASKLRDEVDGIAQVVVEAATYCACEYGDLKRSARQRYEDEERAMSAYRRDRLAKSVEMRKRTLDKFRPSEVHVP